VCRAGRDGPGTARDAGDLTGATKLSRRADAPDGPTHVLDLHLLDDSETVFFESDDLPDGDDVPAITKT